MSNSTSFMQYEQQAYPISHGRTFYVGTDSTPGQIDAQDTGNGVPGEDTWGVQKHKPFASLAYALTKVVDARGDRILMLPGHTEAITGAAGVALDATKDGLTIEGLGNLGNRPVISFTTATTATMTVAGAGIVLKNMDILCAIDEQATMITVTGAAFGMENVYVRASNAGAQCKGVAVTLGAGSDRSWMKNVQIIGETANSDNDLEALSINTADDCYFEDCYFDVIGAAGVGPVHYVGAALRNRWKRCVLRNNIANGDCCVDMDSLAVGATFEDCYFVQGTIANDGADLVPITGASAQVPCFECYCTDGAAGPEAGILMAPLAGA